MSEKHYVKFLFVFFLAKAIFRPKFFHKGRWEWKKLNKGPYFNNRWIFQLPKITSKQLLSHSKKVFQRLWNQFTFPVYQLQRFHKQPENSGTMIKFENENSKFTRTKHNIKSIGIVKVIIAKFMFCKNLCQQNFSKKCVNAGHFLRE